MKHNNLRENNMELTNEERWKARFGQRFPHKIAEVIDDFGSTTKEDIKGFISQEIKSTRLATLEEVERELVKKFGYKTWGPYYPLGLLDKVIQKLKNQ